MKKLILVFYISFMSLFILQGCASNTNAGANAESTLYQPTNTTNYQQQYQQQQRVIHSL